MFGTNAKRLNLKIAQAPDGSFRAELNSIDQPPIIPIPATTVNYDKPHTTVLFQGIGALFDGELDDSGRTIAGKWAQARTTPITFNRTDAKAGETARTDKAPSP
jgi:hypothetical protein